MLNEFNRKLIFEDGNEYFGYSFGEPAERVCEIVFNTSMVGYQEILSDPSYTYQAVVMTYPLIGNYGIAEEDYETANPSLGAFIVGEYNDRPSNFRSIATLSNIMKKYHIPGVYGIDTRKLTRNIRKFGSRKVLITDAATSKEKGLQILAETSVPSNAVSQVSRKKIETTIPEVSEFHVVAIDCGMKQNIVRSLQKRNCTVTAVPYHTTAEAIRTLKPDGVLISNGPGNPNDVPEVIATIQKLRGEYPIFGICLGHQLICLAYGASCYKLKFGHRGGNHPVKNLLTGKVEITSQNHSYAVSTDGIEKTRVEITHINLLDQTVEGLRIDEDRIFSTQYHPESASGPEDSKYLFGLFIHNMEAMKEGR